MGLKLSDKMWNLQSLFHHFINTDWIYESPQADRVIAAMSPQEQKEFNFDPATIDWDRCLHDYTFGIQRYFFKEDRMAPETGFKQTLA